MLTQNSSIFLFEDGNPIQFWFISRKITFSGHYFTLLVETLPAESTSRRLWREEHVHQCAVCPFVHNESFASFLSSVDNFKGGTRGFCCLRHYAEHWSGFKSCLTDYTKFDFVLRWRIVRNSMTSFWTAVWVVPFVLHIVGWKKWKQHTPFGQWLARMSKRNGGNGYLPPGIWD